MFRRYLKVTKPGIIMGNLIALPGDSCWPPEVRLTLR